MLQNLRDLSQTDLETFLDNIDDIILDIEGVVWMIDRAPIDGIKATLEKLKQLNKNIYFVTSNNMLGFSKLYECLTELIPDLQETHIANSAMAMISYLKSINFTKDVYICGSPEMIEDFRKAGFSVAETGVDPYSDVEWNFLCFVKKLLKRIDKIGAVILDTDVNWNFATISKMINCLNKEEVLFLSGSRENDLQGKDVKLISQGDVEFLINFIMHRTSVCFGKPEEKFKNYLMDRFENINPNKTLYVGDSLDVDILFGKKCGFQTMLVLTGSSQLETLKDHSNHIQPDFYLDSFGDLSTILKNKLNI